MKKTTLEINGKGHFEVEFTDGFAGIAIYDKTLNDAIEILARMDREVKSITWVEN